MPANWLPAVFALALLLVAIALGGITDPDAQGYRANPHAIFPTAPVGP